MRNNSGLLASKVMAVILLGVLCALFAWLLKTVAEEAEHQLFRAIKDYSAWLLIVTPIIGLWLVQVITRMVFNTSIGGIREIMNALLEPVHSLKPIKAIVHFLTGFCTLVFGGSTGIEVSTVVASAATGSWVGRRAEFGDDFRKHLIMVGAAAGIAGLFKSPLAGVFFAVEVLMVGFSWELIAFSIIASFTAFGVRYYFDSETLFHPVLDGWKLQSIPYYILFSLIAAVLSVFMTRGVIGLKAIFASRFESMSKVILGGLMLGILILLFNPLYGEGYSSIETLLANRSLKESFSPASELLLLGALVLLKPLATSLTLAAGGDGGVFAPSLFLGAVAGCLFAQGANYFFGASVIEVNFIIVGMAAILSASLHAPLTAAFLTMSISGSYVLILPILITSYFASFIAKRIFPFTVYSYST